jgi:hypothetical protein
MPGEIKVAACNELIAAHLLGIEWQRFERVDRDENVTDVRLRGCVAMIKVGVRCETRAEKISLGDNSF